MANFKKFFIALFGKDSSIIEIATLMGVMGALGMLCMGFYCLVAQRSFDFSSFAIGFSTLTGATGAGKFAATYHEKGLTSTPESSTIDNPDA